MGFGRGQSVNPAFLLTEFGVVRFVVLVEVETGVGICSLGRKGEDEIFVLSGVSFVDRLAYYM